METMHGSDMSGEFLTMLGAAIGGLACAAVALHVFFAIALTVMGRKTNTSGSILAWLPLFNLYYMCKVGRRSGAWVLLMLVPVLNLFVFSMVWASIAGARGKPSWTGPLVMLPPFTLLIPIYLAAGRGAAPYPVAMQYGAVAMGPPMPMPPPAATARHCPKCGAAAVPGDAFCRHCKRPLPVVASRGAGVPPIAPPPPAPAFYPPPPVGGVWPPGISFAKAASVGFIMLLFVVGVQAAAGYYFLGGAISYSPPVAREAPALPPRLAGTMTEFPVDPQAATSSGARPVSVVSQQFAQPGLKTSDKVPSPFDGSSAPTPQLQVPKEWLPPGIEATAVSGQTEAITSAVYREGPPEPAVGVTSEEPPAMGPAIYVHVIVVPIEGNTIADQYARSIEQSTGGQRRGVEVRSPSGELYAGSKVTGPGSSQSMTYVLAKQSSPVVVVIYAPQPAQHATAERLARSVGNGRGLNDYPNLQGAIGLLPASLPDGLELAELNSITPDDLGAGTRNVDAAVSSSEDAEIARQWALVRPYMPRRFTHARYRDPSGQDWIVGVCEFNSARKATNLWWLFRWTLASKGWQSATVRGTQARHIVTAREPVLIFQKGPYLILMKGPAGGAAERLVRLGDKFQM